MFIEIRVGQLSGTINYTLFIKKIEFDYKALQGYGGRVDQVGRRRPIAGGQYYESFEDEKTKNIYRNDIFLHNSPNRTIRGAILDSLDVGIQKWFHAGITEEIAFGRLITDAVWKGVYRNFMKLETNLFGVVDNNQIVAHLHTLKFDELPNKIFMITSLDVDIRNEQSEISCIELLNDSNTDDFDQQATNRKTRYISDLGGVLFNNYDPYNLNTPADFAFGYFGYLFDGVFRSRRRRNG